MSNFKVIGQGDTGSEIHRILSIVKVSEGHIRPHFMLTGPSGSGKTILINAIAKRLQMPVIEINAAQLTKEGTSGNSLSKALSSLRNHGHGPAVCFVDEFDKLFISGNSNSELAHETTHGVQNEFLKILESNTASVFFIGRVGLVFHTNKLSLDDLIEILKSSPLLDSYLQLFDQISRKQVIKDISDFLEKNYEYNTLGARIVNTLLHQYFVKDGKLESENVDPITFKKKLTFGQAD